MSSLNFLESSRRNIFLNTFSLLFRSVSTPFSRPKLSLHLQTLEAKFPCMAATIEGEDRVLATAQHIVNSLRTSKDVTDDMLLILSSFDNRLSNISDLVNNKNTGTSSGGGLMGSDPLDSDPLMDELESAERVILRHDSAPGHQRYLWDDSTRADESCEYLAAVDELLALMEDLGFQVNDGAMDRAESTVQVAMAKLEDEFHNLLAKNTVPLDAERLYGSIRRVSLSFAENEEEEFIEGFDYFGLDDDGGRRRYHERGGSLIGEDISMEIVNPAIIADLREIAERMIRAGYEKECCQVYSSVRRDVLDEYLEILGVEKLSIEEVQRVEWTALDEKMKKWVQAVKIVVKVLLKGEKRLCEQIFDGSDMIKQVCFMEIAKGCVMQLLNFGEAVAIGKRSSEKLFRILDMYDALAAALPLFQGLFSDEAGEFVCNEANGVLVALGEAAKGTLAEFEKAVKTESSKKPTQGGEIHPLARYVMNYNRLVVDYSQTLNTLLEFDANEPNQSENDSEMSPLRYRVLSLLGCLESNLEEKAKLYEDIAMQYIFLMNNKLYIVQKVKDSELAVLLGDDWVRRRRGLIRKYATNYLRSSWIKLLSYLKDEGIGGSSNNASKAVLKERFKSFNASFEELYRVQTGWKVPDPQLRTELSISVSEKVIPAYRQFLGRYGSQLESGRNAGKYVKYSAEDIEGYLADLFEGTPKIVHYVKRKGA